jgi:hypothetical protein
METLIIINTIFLGLIVIYIAWKEFFSKITIKINRTFWEKKPYGITIIKWDYPIKESESNSGKGFPINWRNPDKIKDDIKKAVD